MVFVFSFKEKEIFKEYFLVNCFVKLKLALLNCIKNIKLWWKIFKTSCTEKLVFAVKPSQLNIFPDVSVTI